MEYVAGTPITTYFDPHKLNTRQRMELFIQVCEGVQHAPLPQQFIFADPEKIRELAKRGEAWGDSERQQMLEHGIENGRRGCYLRLTPDQYARLRRP